MFIRKPNVIEDCKFSIAACDDASEVRNVLDGYFRTVVWSLEKDEWDNWTDDVKNQFCVLVFNKVKGC